MIPDYTPDPKDCPLFDGWVNPRDFRPGRPIWSAPEDAFGSKKHPSDKPLGWLIAWGDSTKDIGDARGLVLSGYISMQTITIGTHTPGRQIKWHYHKKEEE